MKTQSEVLDKLRQSGDLKNLDAQLLAAFSKSSAIAFCILDNDCRYRFVNNALVAMHNGVPNDAFIGSTFRDILEDAAPETEARFQQLSLATETPASEVRVKLPSRTEPGYWIEKNLAITGRLGGVVQIVSLAVEVTDNRKLEQRFRKLGNELLWTNAEYQRLAQELHHSINEYHVALGMCLEGLSRCTRNPEQIPELLAQSTDLLDKDMQKLSSAVAKCFAIHQSH